MVSLKRQYKKDIGSTSLAYDTHDEAVSRMISIHGSSRQRMCISGPVLWNRYFDQLWTTRKSIPSDPQEFEDWFKSQIRTLSLIIASNRLHRNCSTNSYAIGMAQKCLNLFLKDLWAFDKVTELQANNFHATLDRKVLKHCPSIPKSWDAWTNVIADSENEFEELYCEYLCIQRWFKLTQTQLSNCFKNVVELEQFIWHFENNGCTDVVSGKLTRQSR